MWRHGFKSRWDTKPKPQARSSVRGGGIRPAAARGLVAVGLANLTGCYADVSASMTPSHLSFTLA
jgi:hypothetical protein